MAVSFGKLEEFDTANGDDWVQYEVQYIERMNITFWQMKLRTRQSNTQFLLVLWDRRHT